MSAVYPRVKALHFVVEQGGSTDYSDADALSLQEPLFDIQVENLRACFTMKAHYATEAEAREVVDSYIAAWEFEAGLRHGPTAFKLRFDCADIEDRDPTTRKVFIQPKAGRIHGKLGPIQLTLGRGHYPPPPREPIAVDPTVQSMFDRYMGHRSGKEPLPGMAYFCVTVLEAAAGGPRKAAEHYRISQSVLTRIRSLSSTKGGPGTARKQTGVNAELSQAERRFLEQAVKAVIRRAAEVAHSPCLPLKNLTRNDFR
ncbi:MAG: hypothetical protein OXE57_09605 [Alphaproteobacteria bacterium]|nr:hypothetical protein [Alphaproteobacteria bacterium]